MHSEKNLLQAMHLRRNHPKVQATPLPLKSQLLKPSQEPQPMARNRAGFSPRQPQVSSVHDPDGSVDCDNCFLHLRQHWLWLREVLLGQGSFQESHQNTAQLTLVPCSAWKVAGAQPANAFFGNLLDVGPVFVPQTPSFVSSRQSFEALIHGWSILLHG